MKAANVSVAGKDFGFGFEARFGNTKVLIVFREFRFIFGLDERDAADLKLGRREKRTG